jgi:hypothetical protein
MCPPPIVVLGTALDIVQQKVNRHRNIKSRNGNSSKSTMFASVVKTANHEAF